MRSLPGFAVALVAAAVLTSPALGQEGGSGVSGWVFLAGPGEGGGGKVYAELFTMQGKSLKGVCVEGYEYVIGGVEPGRYKLRFGFGCGQNGNRPPYIWFDGSSGGTDGHACAAVIRVTAGHVTEGLNATLDPARGPASRCGSNAKPGATGQVGVQRPAPGAAASPSPSPVGEIDFTPGIVADPRPTTPLATVIGVSAGAVAAVGVLVWWLLRRARRLEA